MKRCVVALIGLLFFACTTVARAETPNIRQSINYFMNYFNEAVVQAIHLKEKEQKGHLEQNRPYSQDYVFYLDMTDRIEKTLGLSLNLCDIYYIYNKTTYCFTKDEKNYLFDRIDNIVATLKKVKEAPYNIDKKVLDDKKSPIAQDISAFNDRIDKLIAFIKTSLVVFQR